MHERLTHHVFFVLAVTAALRGVRSMFRLTGGALSVTGVSLALTFFPDRGQGLSIVFGWFSLAMLVVVPLALTIPDSARERRLQQISLAEKPSLA